MTLLSYTSIRFYISILAFRKLLLVSYIEVWFILNRLRNIQQTRINNQKLTTTFDIVLYKNTVYALDIEEIRIFFYLITGALNSRTSTRLKENFTAASNFTWTVRDVSLQSIKTQTKQFRTVPQDISWPVGEFRWCYRISIEKRRRLKCGLIDLIFFSQKTVPDIVW